MNLKLFSILGKIIPPNMSKTIAILGICFLMLSSCKPNSEKNSSEFNFNETLYDSLKKNRKTLKFGIYNPNTNKTFNPSNYKHFDFVSFVGYDINPKTGEVINTEEWETSTVIDSLQARDIYCVLQATTSGINQNHEFLSNPKAMATFTVEVSSMLAIRNANGVHLHLEEIALADSERLSTFVAMLAQHLKKQGRMMFLSLPNANPDAYDVVALNPYVDAFLLMPLPDPKAQPDLKDYYLKRNIPEQKLLEAQFLE